MGLDLTLPATGKTRDGDLYKVLRDNFNGLYAKFGPLVPTVVNGILGGTVLVPVTYVKDGCGWVHLSGTVYSTLVKTTYPVYQVWFGLPSGFIPTEENNHDQTVIFPNRVKATYSGNPFYYDIIINTIYSNGVPGEITSLLGDGGSTYIYFDGISFKAT